MTAEEILKSKYEGKRYSFPKDKELWAAMKEIASIAFDARFDYSNHYHSVSHPTKEQFIKELFKTKEG